MLLRAPREGWARAWQDWPPAVVTFKVRCDVCEHRTTWATRSLAAEDAAWHRAENLTHFATIQRRRYYRDDIIEATARVVQVAWPAGLGILAGRYLYPIIGYLLDLGRALV